MSRSRILLHWIDLPNYAQLCISELRHRNGVEVLVLYSRSNSNTPYKRPDIAEREVDIANLTDSEVETLLMRFNPDIAIVGGWTWHGVRLARMLKSRRIPVVATCDNGPRTSFKQKLLPLYYRFRIKGLFDFFWVPGKAATELLVKAGVPESRIWDHLYAPASSGFLDVGRQRALEVRRRASAFLFVGQLIERKGVPELLKAFAVAQTDWRLIVCGAGPLKHLVVEYAAQDKRIELRGFIQPSQMPQVMQDAQAFVLPARQENWGLVIGEAAAAGLPVLCSDCCGAALELVRDGKTGFLFKPGDPSELQAVLERTTRLQSSTLSVLGQEGHRLALSFTPKIWADVLLRNIDGIARATSYS